MSVHTILQRACHVNDTDMKCRFTPHCDVLTARGDVLTASGRVQRDTITYNSALSACEKGEHWQQALGSFERMQGEYVQRNTITYSAAIRACEKGGQLQQALELCERLV